MEIDYSKYTIEQLLQAKATIDSKVAPDNYRNLLAELENRSSEIEQMKQQLEKVRQLKEEKYSQSKFKIVPAVAFLQLVGGAFLILLSLPSLIFVFSPLFSILTIGFSIFSILAGWLLLKGHKDGFTLTYLNQILQIPVIYSSTFVYKYSALGGIYFGVDEDVKIGFSFSFSPGIELILGEIETTGSLSVDLLAIAIIILLKRESEIKSRIASKLEKMGVEDTAAS